MATGRGLRRLLVELRGERDALRRVLVASLLVRLFGLAVPLLTALVVDQVVPRADRHLLLVAAIGVGVLVAFDALASVMRAHLLLHLRTRVDTRVTAGFLDHLFSLPFSFFQGRSTADLLQRVGSSATAREMLTSGSLAGMLDGCTALLYAATIIALSPRLGLLVLVLAGLHAAVFLLTRRRARQLMAADLEAQSRAQGHLVEMLGGFETLRCAGAESVSVARWLELYRAQLGAALERGTLGAGVDTVRRALESLAPIGILTIGALAVTSGELSLGAMLAIGALASGMFGALSALVATALQLELVAAYLEKIDEVMETPREQEAHGVIPHETVSRSGGDRSGGEDPNAPAIELQGAISLRELSFRYGDDAPLVVADVSLDIAPGASVAIVGPSGSGKSTLAGLLVGLHRAAAGEIQFDGRSLSRLDVREVRRQIGAVPQSPSFFAATVRENIAIGDPESDPGQILWAAQIACIHDVIEAMPRGYDTPLTGAGAPLSGGQRQRVAIARAVLRCPAIIVLDEATSALDAVTENRIMNHLGWLGATRILVAQRLSTIVDADLIVVMDEGRVVETGTHRELLAHRGAYAAMAQERPPLEIAS